MNSIFNEHPLRKINEEFINKSIESLQKDSVIKKSSNLLILLHLFIDFIIKDKLL